MRSACRVCHEERKSGLCAEHGDSVRRFDALAIRERFAFPTALREGVLYEMEGRFRHQDVRNHRTAKSLANQ